jgi:hypothetical protein
VGDLVELSVVLVPGVDEVLNLCHRELTHSKQALSWCDLVSEAEPDLSGRKGHFLIVVL